MARRGVDFPSLQMVIVFTLNVVLSYWYADGRPSLKTAGEALLIIGALLFVYVVAYLRSGFFGETEPTLDRLITKGPYRFCRHPLYLSFITLVLGLDLMVGSILGGAFTLFLSIPSAAYRARVEDRLLMERFGEEWECYSARVGFLLPKPAGGRKEK